jgi:hypothetical protein
MVDGQVVVHNFLADAIMENITASELKIGKADVYILKIPWEEFGFNHLPHGKHIGFNMTYNENDGKNFVGWLEWTPGICGGTLPNEFGDLIIE